MKGCILAGGTGSRLYPLTAVTNKHLLPVGNKPMIYHSIEKMVSAGIENILVVTGVEHMGNVLTLLGSGKNFGCKFTYKVQDAAGGIAQALGLAEDFAWDDSLCVILGDNIFQDPLDLGRENIHSAKIFLKEVPDPSRFGVATISGSKVVEIEEKPKQPKSSLAVTGIYIYPPRVFDFIKQLRPSARGEYEISDVNNRFISENLMECGTLKGWWSDAGTFSSLHHVNNLLLGG